MANLKNSILLLFSYLILVFGIAQVQYVEENVLNFEPAFFVLMAVAVLVGIVLPSMLRMSIYVFLIGWTVIYALVWLTYWRFHIPTLSFQLLGIQFILVIISAGLSFDLGKQIQLHDVLLNGLSSTTYPNRTLELDGANDRISAEITRSRRYQHPLSLLIIELRKGGIDQKENHLEGLQRDLLNRFASAKMGQIISDRARETDLIIRDHLGRFLVICPETTLESSAIFAERISRAVHEDLGANTIWSSAAFPIEALTFEELLEQAESRLSKSRPSSTLGESASPPINTDTTK